MLANRHDMNGAAINYANFPILTSYLVRSVRRALQHGFVENPSHARSHAGEAAVLFACFFSSLTSFELFDS